MAITVLQADTETVRGIEAVYQIQAGDTLILAAQDKPGATVSAPVNVVLDPGTGTTLSVSVRLSSYSSAAWVPVPQYDAITGTAGLPLNAPFAQLRIQATGGAGNSQIEVISAVTEMVRITS